MDFDGNMEGYMSLLSLTLKPLCSWPWKTFKVFTPNFFKTTFYSAWILLFCVNQDLWRKESEPPLNLILQEITQTGSEACSEVPEREEDALSWKWQGDPPCDSVMASLKRSVESLQSLTFKQPLLCESEGEKTQHWGAHGSKDEVSVKDLKTKQDKKKSPHYKESFF